MKRRLILLPILVLASLAPGIALQNPYPADGCTVDWKRGVIIAYGTSGMPGDPRPETGTLHRQRNEGYDTARERARENLAAGIRSIRVDRARLMGDLLAQSLESQTVLSRLITERASYRQYPRTWIDSGCRIELPISALLDTVPDRFPGDEFPEMLHNPLPTGYTGLVIDARGIGVRPMLLPTVLNESGLAIYGPHTVDTAEAHRYGIVAYVNDEDEAMKNLRAGSRPYYAVALGISNGNPVLSYRDAARVLSSAETRKQLRGCRVVFIIDRGE